MTKLDILRYAYEGAYDIWKLQYDKCEENPDDKDAREKLEKVAADVRELRRARLAEKLKLRQEERERKGA